MTTTLDIYIWQTRSLTDYCDRTYNEPQRAASIAKTYLNGALDQSGAYDGNVTIKSGEPDPKYEGPAGTSFTQPCLCDDTYECSYGSLWDFWNKWLARSCASVTRAGNVDLLLTNWDGSGLAAGDTAVAAVGQSIADNAPTTYQKFGGVNDGGTVFNKLDTVLEEVGHALKSQGSCSDQFADDNDNDGSGHDSGVVAYNSADDYYAITPIGVTGDTCSNDCQGTEAGTDYCKGRTDIDGDGDPEKWAMFYSQCTECFFP